MRHLALGMLGTNCYLLFDEQTRELVIIDPAAEADRITEVIDPAGYKPAAILLTHGHHDHIGAVSALRDKYRIPVMAAEQEREVLEDPAVNLSLDFGDRVSLSADVWLSDHETISPAGFEIRVLLTPGHTKGSACYYLPEQQLLFSGDTLFEGSVGRTDFPTGSMSVLVRSVKEQLMPLPDEVQVFPGHGPSTTIGWERRYNPFL